MVTGLGGVQFTLFVKNICQKRKKGKEKKNDPVLFFRVNLPETKTELSFKSFTTGILFLPFVL